ncbi:MAG: hypothetical protein RQ866_08115, partial [Bacteroidales bacterium]|nr:hypothetical protein [Bacteroidales bacterium]
FGLGASVLLFYIAGTAILVLSIFIFCVVKYTGPKQRILFRLRKIIIGFWQGLISVARLRRPWLFVGYSVAIWFMYLLTTYFCFLSLPATSLLEIDIALAVLVTGSVGIMVTPGGIGLYPIIVRDTLILYGIAATSGFAVGWITWSAQTIMIIIVGTGSLVWLSFIKKKVPLKSNIIRNLERDNDT